MVDLQYDVPVEVNQKQYNAIRRDYAGSCPHREDNGKYYIKLWYMSNKDHVEKCLIDNQ